MRVLRAVAALRNVSILIVLLVASSPSDANGTFGCGLAPEDEVDDVRDEAEERLDEATTTIETWRGRIEAEANGITDRIHETVPRVLSRLPVALLAVPARATPENGIGLPTEVPGVGGPSCLDGAPGPDSVPWGEVENATQTPPAFGSVPPETESPGRADLTFLAAAGPVAEAVPPVGPPPADPLTIPPFPPLPPIPDVPTGAGTGRSPHPAHALAGDAGTSTGGRGAAVPRLVLHAADPRLGPGVPGDFGGPEGPRFGLRSMGFGVSTPATTPLAEWLPKARDLLPILLVGGAALVPPLLSLFRRLTREHVLVGDTRRAVYSTILDRPGITAGGLARAVGVDRRTILHHVDVLSEYGLIASARVGGRLHYYKNGGSYSDAEKVAHVVLRSPVARRVVAELSRRPGARLVEIVHATGLPKTTVAGAIGRLRAAGLLDDAGRPSPEAVEAIPSPAALPPLEAPALP
ncbi:MAG: winged helix-turn-helix transcriptional regulator [Methanobacteriota archaeon]